MDTSTWVFTGLSLASVIATGGLTMNLTENFGNLAKTGSIKQEINGNKLVGTYGNALMGMSAVVVALSGLYLILFFYKWYQEMKKVQNRNGLNKNQWHQFTLQKIFYLVSFFAILLGVASAAVNINLLDNYGGINDLSTSPDPIVPGQNYKLRGAYGTATLGMAIASTSMASLAFLWIFVIGIRNWNTVHHFALNANRDMSKPGLKLDTS